MLECRIIFFGITEYRNVGSTPPPGGSVCCLYLWGLEHVDNNVLQQ